MNADHAIDAIKEVLRKFEAGEYNKFACLSDIAKIIQEFFQPH